MISQQIQHQKHKRGKREKNRETKMNQNLNFYISKGTIKKVNR